MGCTLRIYILLFALLIFLCGIGDCSRRQDREKTENYLRMLKNKGPIPLLGVEPHKKPTKFIKLDSRETECLSKKEFYEGMEDAEMKGMDDDPSAQDIYDEFNR